MVSVKITNATNNTMSLNYAIVETSGDKKFRKVISVKIEPRALLQEVTFPSQDYYNAFVKQNEYLLDEGKILINASTSESKLEQASKDIATKENASARKKKNQAIEKIEKSINNKNTKLKISVDKLAE